MINLNSSCRLKIDLDMKTNISGVKKKKKKGSYKKPKGTYNKCFCFFGYFTSKKIYYSSQLVKFGFGKVQNGVFRLKRKHKVTFVTFQELRF
jgi:hypothetical protein